MMKPGCAGLPPHVANSHAGEAEVGPVMRSVSLCYQQCRHWHSPYTHRHCRGCSPGSFEITLFEIDAISSQKPLFLRVLAQPALQATQGKLPWSALRQLADL